MVFDLTQSTYTLRVPMVGRRTVDASVAGSIPVVEIDGLKLIKMGGALLTHR